MTTVVGMASEATTRQGVSVGLIRMGKWKRCPLWLNRSLMCMPRRPMVTDSPIVREGH